MLQGSWPGPWDMSPPNGLGQAHHSCGAASWCCGCRNRQHPHQRPVPSTFYQAVMSRDWARLERGDAAPVWQGARARFLSQVVGPHFESLCREYAMTAGEETFGGPPGEAGSGVVGDAGNRTQIQIDVAVLAPAEHGRPRHILSLGEVKWDRVMDAGHLERLRRARDLLAVKGFDTRDTILACYSGAGFTPDLQAAHKESVALIGLDQLYR